MVSNFDVFFYPKVPEFGVGARVIWAMSAGDRESEAQAKKGEEGAGGDRDSRAAAALKQYWCVGLRVAELVSTHTHLRNRSSRRLLGLIWGEC